MPFVLLAALRGCAGPDVLVGDLVRVFGCDADGEV